MPTLKSARAIPLLLVELRSTGAGAVFAGRRGAYQDRLRMTTSRLYRSVLQGLTGIPAMPVRSW